VKSKATVHGWHDPSLLVQEAMALFGDGESAPRAKDISAESAIRRAHELVSPDLYVIERLKQAGVEPNFADLFGKQSQEKIAALIFLTKHKLLDIEQCTLQSRDTDDARRDLSTYVEVLFRMQAVDALTIFYDYANFQRDSRVPWLWRNVATRCLYLMALMYEARRKVIAFLKDRTEVRRMIDALLETTTKEIGDVLRALIQDYNTVLQSTVQSVADDPPAPYVAIAEQYEREAPAGAMSGYSSLLTAQDRIRQAAGQGDLAALMDWIAQGSPAAMQATFRQAMAVLSVPQYVSLLEKTLEQPDLDPRRMALAVLELSAVNRSSNTPGGLPAVNKILADVAVRVPKELDAVGRLAVRALAEVKAMPELQRVLESTQDLVVAGELIDLLTDMHRLPLVEAVVKKRPVLEPAFRRARRRFLERQELVDAACACSSEELAAIYLAQLKAQHAVTELEQISLLQNHASQLAREILNTLRAEELPTRRAQ